MKSVITRLEVLQALVDPHPLVAKWLKQAQSAKTHEGHLMTAWKHVLRSHISAAQVDRSALIFDTLIKASEALGQCWTTMADNETSIEIDGEKLKLLLKERITRITIPPPPSSPPKRGVPWTSDFLPRVAPQYEWVPTGELSLQLEADTEHVRGRTGRTPRRRGLKIGWRTSSTGSPLPSPSSFSQPPKVMAI